MKHARCCRIAAYMDKGRGGLRAGASGAEKSSSSKSGSGRVDGSPQPVPNAGPGPPSRAAVGGAGPLASLLRRVRKSAELGRPGICMTRYWHRPAGQADSAPGSTETKQTVASNS